jgi:glycosyltransferase involved in cell wall biosynthesis
MKINIASFGGRSHLLNLSKELINQGHSVNFYSYLPNRRAKRFGLKKEHNKNYFTLAVPFLLLLKITKRAQWAVYLYHRFFDWHVSRVMKPCDVFIGHSPMHLKSLLVAKNKFNATVVLERGTSHVSYFIERLKENPFKKSTISEKNIQRDLAGYEHADYISIPSNYVAESFVRHGIPQKKLFVNAYGVDLSDFQPTKLEAKSHFDMIFVGQWSYRKGADLMTELCEKNPQLSMIHLGTMGDVPISNSKNIVHVSAVNEKTMINYYKKSKILILPSREDGFGMVLTQAIACGLPVVCSSETGSKEVKNLLEDDKFITVMEDYNCQELTKCIKIALDISKTQKGKRSYSKSLESKLSWEAYGSRYQQFLEKISANQ